MAMQVADPDDPLALSLPEQLRRELESRGIEVKPRTSLAAMWKLLKESNDQIEPEGLSAPYNATNAPLTERMTRSEVVKRARERRQLRASNRARLDKRRKGV